MTSIQPLEGSEEYRVIQQTEPLTDIQIHVSVFSLFLPHMERTRYMKITTLYVPENHLLWWIWQNITKTSARDYHGLRIEQFLGNCSFHSSNGRIIYFKCFYSQVCIIESSEIWEDYSEAYHSVVSVAEKEGLSHIRYNGKARMMDIKVSSRTDFLNFVENGQLGSSDKDYRYKIIDLSNYITDPFFYKIHRCVGGPQNKTKITAKKFDNRWYVELEGVSKKTATFILDENYEVLDVFGKAVEGPFIYERR